MSRLRSLLTVLALIATMGVAGCSSQPAPTPAPSTTAAKAAAQCTHVELRGDTALPSAATVVCDDGLVIPLDPMPVAIDVTMIPKKPLGDSQHEIRAYIYTSTHELRVWWGPERFEKDVQGNARSVWTISFWTPDSWNGAKTGVVDHILN